MQSNYSVQVMHVIYIDHTHDMEGEYKWYDYYEQEFADFTWREGEADILCSSGIIFYDLDKLYRTIQHYSCVYTRKRRISKYAKQNGLMECNV
ncbi:hypothetical protein SeMB42_g06428, partial [Synchytrium endobioticum]